MGHALILRAAEGREGRKVGKRLDSERESSQELPHPKGKWCFLVKLSSQSKE